ncbi:DUF3794 domain-containing protein [Clostridioides sp. ES-S-0145-01]|uniref:DUF3794 domain-containing protein n=1 Tax=Clostridioides sp. ES-S-0145-01 TaxID=2770784 RepID=UPI001D104E43|nr:DUF3794 domain-containing protein [Clostridioides sp. ES-S-0145-01]
MNSNACACNMDLIDVSGLCDIDDVTQVISQYPYWFQMYIPETLSIPIQKPDIEQINSVNVSVNILRTKVVKTPVSSLDANCDFIPNLEGKISTGRKIIVEGELCQKISYTADERSQSVHSAHFYVPFSSYIVIPQKITFNKGTKSMKLDSLDVDYQVNACIEDLSVSLLDARTISKYTTLLLYAIPRNTL